MRTWECPICKAKLKAIANSVSCVGLTARPPAASTNHKRTLMKEVVPA